jgi:hypothetical protein
VSPGKIDEFEELCRNFVRQTYAVQENADLSTGVDCRLLTTELAHFA